MGECVSQTWEAKKPVLLAMKYGFLALRTGQCLDVMGAVVSHETCAIQTTGYQPGKIVYKPGQMWTLTVNDELKTDENDFCLKTTGLLEGTWSDPWSKGKIFDVKMDGDKITYSECDGDLVGKWADAFNNNDEYKLCMNSKTGAVTMPGASGTFLHGKMEMSFGGGPIHTATLSGDKLNWDNNNVWTKVANSEDAVLYAGRYAVRRVLAWAVWRVLAF